MSDWHCSAEGYPLSVVMALLALLVVLVALPLLALLVVLVALPLLVLVVLVALPAEAELPATPLPPLVPVLWCHCCGQIAFGNTRTATRTVVLSAYRLRFSIVYLKPWTNTPEELIRLLLSLLSPPLLLLPPPLARPW